MFAQPDSLKLESGTRACVGRLARLAVMVFACLVALGGSGCTSHPASRPSDRAALVLVTGMGASFEAARDDGLERAILNTQGTLVLTERQLLNDQLKEEGVSYSRGLVRDYQVLDTRVDSRDLLVRVYMRVKVTTSPMGKRILYASDTSEVDGLALTSNIDKARRQLDIERHRDTSALNLLDHLMSEFHLAFLDVQKTRLESYSENGQVHLRARFTASVNRSAFGNVCTAASNYAEAQHIPESLRAHTRIPGSSYFEQGGFLGCRISKAIYIPDNQYDKWKTDISNVGFCVSLVDKSNALIAKQFTPASLLLFQDGIAAREYRDFLTRNLGFLGTVYGDVRYQAQVDNWLGIAGEAAEIKVRTSSKEVCR